MVDRVVGLGGRFACGCAPAFGSKVRALRGLFYGTAEAVPLRGFGGGPEDARRVEVGLVVWLKSVPFKAWW
jgi:hypothetical protein